jgi:hypothetical protein
MRRIGVVLALTFALSAPVTSSYAGVGWGTLTDEAAIHEGSIPTDSVEMTSPYYILWTVLLPALL